MIYLNSVVKLTVGGHHPRVLWDTADDRNLFRRLSAKTLIALFSSLFHASNPLTTVEDHTGKTVLCPSVTQGRKKP